MKILLLNPRVDAAHNAPQLLQERGIALLSPQDATEAWQMLQLHGGSVELVIVHVEGGNGLELVKKLKSSPAQKDTPMIITSEKWGDAEFSAHQKSPQGANAYLKWPFTGEQLIEMVAAVVGLPEKTEVGGVAVPPPFPSQEFDGEIGLSLEIPQSEAPQMESALEQAASPGEASADSGLSLDIGIEPPSDEDPPALELLGVQTPSAPSTEELSILQFQPPDATPDATEEGGAALDEPTRIQTSLEDAGETRVIPEGEHLTLDSLQDGDGGLDLQVPDSSASEDELTSPPPREETSEDESAPYADELPYLFDRREEADQERAGRASVALPFTPQMGDALVPGGAAQSPDVDTLKKYLLLREQDVTALSAQLRVAREQIGRLDSELVRERAKSSELAHTVEDQRRKIAEFEREKQLSLQGLQSEIGELRFQVKAKTDKARLLELQVREAAEEMDRLKERVRSDIRKIRVRERDLENRLEIMKKDAEALLSARENKIIELKRKLDLLEFNMDLLQDRYSREKDKSEQLKERLGRASQAMRVVGGLLDSRRGDGEADANSLAEALSEALSDINSEKGGSSSGQAAS